jgi:hypothetical protein
MDEWVTCAEFYRYLCVDTEPDLAAGLIQLEGSTGNLEGRAGKAVVATKGIALRLSDWLIPPCAWQQSLTFPVRLQGRSNAFQFYPALGKIEGDGYRVVDLGLSELPDAFASFPSLQVSLSLSRIVINPRDAAELGYHFSPETDHDANPSQIETLSVRHSRTGRGRGHGIGGYAKRDAPIIQKIKDDLDAGRAESPTEALRRYLSEAVGASDKAKTDRIVAKFYERFPEYRIRP